MSQKTKIQWCDSTVNPVMGCLGCELWPTSARITSSIAAVIAETLVSTRSSVRREVKCMLHAYPHASAIWHARHRIVADLVERFPGVSAETLLNAITSGFRCYAGFLHLRFAANPEKPDKRPNSGYAPTFEHPASFAGRMEKASRWSDLRGQDRHEDTWLNGLPRLIFVSDMGDALSDGIAFSFLKEEIIDNVTSEAGSRHRWLWLTKRPARMAEFAAWLHDEHGVEWPSNLIAMTSVTNRATRSRIDELRTVPAAIRGLSVEPLVEDVTLDLEGIDWVIVGGESGDAARPFDLAWVRSLREQCLASGTELFVKQLGSKPVEDGESLCLRDGHGGDWSEWPEDIRIREVPEGFRNNQSDEQGAV